MSKATISRDARDQAIHGYVNFVTWVRYVKCIFQVKQIQELVNQDYEFCGHKVAYGELISDFEEWKIEYMIHYKKLTRN